MSVKTTKTYYEVVNEISEENENKYESEKLDDSSMCRPCLSKQVQGLQTKSTIDLVIS